MIRNMILSPCRVALVDEEPVVISGLRALLPMNTSIAFTASDSGQLLERLTADIDTTPLILIADLSLPYKNSCNEYRLAQKILRLPTPPKLVMLTRETNTIILRQLLNIGECSLLSKKDEPSVYLEPALMACQQGIFFASPLIQRTISVHGLLKKKSDSPLTSLTPRELEVLRLCACGLRVKDIARKLNRSECTVAVHKHNAMQKLELTSNMQLLNFLHSQEQD
ncbi:response regulator transcription factor [Escherichia albertii]|uniref:response regulator transcription factor n=1 Tax=Escherichia albertii TaxID=208962 RepID=UPI0010F9A822|nr:response regulator transcription factor [Escherichia albertii]